MKYKGGGGNVHVTEQIHKTTAKRVTSSQYLQITVLLNACNRLNSLKKDFAD